MLQKVLLGGFLASSLYYEKSKKPQCCGIFGVISSTPNIESKANPTTQKSSITSV
jgi:hypothetical protein